MPVSGMHQRPRVSGEGNACERFELPNGAMTLGWSSEGDLLCILSGVAGEGFSLPLERRLTTVLLASGRVRLWLDLFDMTDADPGFTRGLGGWLEGHSELVADARAVVANEVASRTVEALSRRIAGRIEILRDPESQAELYTRFARGA
jgi:hypothetical protein